MANQERSIDLLVNVVKANDDYQQRLKQNPVGALQDLARDIKLANPLPTNDDRIAFRIAVLALSLVVLAVVGCGIAIYVLTFRDAAQPRLPDFLLALGSTALGALAGMLVPINQRGG
ncbi:hypothetical protein J5277_20035 [Rhizobium sp. 16-449-1b]|uniref:hypothetical protein n=1 Tax=Rhizobium sp. 16-449-1b TaxID=2819989 RepID=UPI001ADA8387|nr:hypothetical protein [Rhizobium sp. 16-449-1b]MBO9196398.1 hypothetical protein [Rhizobium sp. 16-449-1b]